MKGKLALTDDQAQKVRDILTAHQPAESSRGFF